MHSARPEMSVSSEHKMLVGSSWNANVTVRAMIGALLQTTKTQRRDNEMGTGNRRREVESREKRHGEFDVLSRALDRCGEAGRATTHTSGGLRHGGSAKGRDFDGDAQLTGAEHHSAAGGGRALEAHRMAGRQQVRRPSEHRRAGGRASVARRSIHLCGTGRACDGLSRQRPNRTPQQRTTVHSVRSDA